MLPKYKTVIFVHGCFWHRHHAVMEWQSEKIALVSAIPSLPISQAVLDAANVYIARKVMPADVTGDALHLAFASVYRCDVLLTWNCLHLANANKFEHIRRVNTELGIHVPLLLTPLELMQTLSSDETGP